MMYLTPNVNPKHAIQNNGVYKSVKRIKRNFFLYRWNHVSKDIVTLM